jgi:regulation of enolase protein 1 (concanavalin A-like superfamily)
MKSSNYLFKIFLSIIFLSFSSLVFSAGTILKTSEEFKFKQAAGFDSEEPYSQVWHYKNSTYLVWIDAKYRAWVTQVTDGKVVTVPVDAQPDYLVQADGHHRFALGVDKSGYIHVTGDMHHYSDLTTGVITPYPTRYQKKKILYWRSNNPEDVTGGFTFQGETFNTAIPGGGWILGRFFTDNNGELFYSSHVHAYESSNNLGQMAVGLYKYNATSKSWTSIGGLASKTDPYLSHLYPVFYWEDSGSSGGWFQNYQASFKFDKNNKMYFAVTSNTNPALAGANRLLFAMSDDGGLTWKKANGKVIGPLPLRGIDNLPSTADVVIDSGTTNFLGAKPGLVVDKNGKPGISIDTKWYVWNGSAWTQDTKLNFGTIPSTDTAYRLSNNELITNSLGYNKLTRTASFDDISIGYDFIGYNHLSCLDDYGLRNSNTIYGISQKDDNSYEAILKTTMESAPLPTGWTSQDIDAVGFPFGGNTGYSNGNFVMTSYGDGLNNQNDSFHFAYKKMRGDGTITTQVSPLQLANGRGGVMMREALTPNAKRAGVWINANKSIIFSARSTVGSYSSDSETPNITPPYWVRLVRAGDVFTGFISPDGTTWKQIQSATIPMNQDIYVGFALASYRFKWYMDATTFSNVSAPADICQHAIPSVSMSPSSQTGNAGDSVNYTFNIKNNDPAACNASTFTLSTILASGLTGTIDQQSVSLAAGASTSTVIHVSSPTTTAPGTYAVAATATNSESTSATASTSGTYILKSPCVTAWPLVSLSPMTQTGPAGGTVSYVVSVANKDSDSCATTSFNLASTLPANISGGLDANTLSLAPGTSGTANLKLSSATTTPANSYKFTVRAGNDTASSAADGTYVVTNDACVISPPTITISPSTLTTSGVRPVNYVVSITNNDTAKCTTRLFSFSTDTSNYYLKGWMEPYNIRLAPQTSATSLITLTPTTDLKEGTYTISTYTQNGGLAKTNLVYQAAEAVSVNTATDQAVYDRKATTYNAALYASVYSNNVLLPNVPIEATLTWPNGTSQTIKTTNGAGTRTFFQDIQMQSQVGIYNFSVIATYQGKQIKSNVMFSVR